MRERDDSHAAESRCGVVVRARHREQMPRRGQGTPPRADAASGSGRVLSEPGTLDCFGGLICERLGPSIT
jgi:hypothetical protein